MITLLCIQIVYQTDLVPNGVKWVKNVTKNIHNTGYLHKFDINFVSCQAILPAITPSLFTKCVIYGLPLQY